MRARDPSGLMRFSVSTRVLEYIQLQLAAIAEIDADAAVRLSCQLVSDLKSGGVSCRNRLPGPLDPDRGMSAALLELSSGSIVI